jgi:nitrous oxidase accessory protein
VAASAGAALGLSFLGAASGAALAAGSGCLPVAAGADLTAAVAAAPEGAVLCLAAGSYDGPLEVDRAVVLRGPPEAVIRSRGAGSTVTLAAPGAALEGVTVDGSGGRHDLLDAAVRAEADDTRVEGVRIRNALFGILAEQVHRVVLRGNDIRGHAEQTLGLRGDAIRLWEVRESIVEDNRIADSRDMVVWYSPGNRIVGNRVSRGRYGTHFMYSHHNVVERNRYDANVVGIFAMYSRDLRIRDNVLARSAGAAGVGLGAKESGDLVVEDNLFVSNRVSVYLDTSPLDLDSWNRFAGNRFHLSEDAVVFHGGADRNRFLGNVFRDNGSPVRVEGRGDARDAEWRGNDFDDYMGYDLDGDGVGDVPYELRSLVGQLVAHNPSLAFFRGSPVLALVELVGRVVPLFQATTILVDPAPRMGPRVARATTGGDADGR